MMKRTLLLIGVIALLGGTVAVSNQNLAAPNDQTASEPFQAPTEDKNPWSHTKFNNEQKNFQFTIVTDRTGGHRPEIFSKAVQRINLLQPEFVLSVGDLIEGYTEDMPRLNAEWTEFQGFVNDFQMPFFYVPGNHDITNDVMKKLWQEKFGRSYYHFTYKGVLFLCLETDDPPQSSSISKEQIEYFKKVLKDNPSPRWTVVAMHKPLWSYGNTKENGWPEVEEALQGRKHTVFAGHVHKYQKYERNGMNYYELATTGGGSRLRGIEYGEFDHLVWVTMKDDGPVLANIMLDGILPENLRIPDTGEPGYPGYGNRQQTHPVTGKVTLRGKPALGAQVNFYLINPQNKSVRFSGDSKIDEDGNYAMTTYGQFDGAVAGQFKVTITPTRGFPGEDRTTADIRIPEKFLNPKISPLTVTVEEGPNTFDFELDD